MTQRSLIVEKSENLQAGQRYYRLSGTLDLYNVIELQSALREEKSDAVLLDVSEVSFIDSAGLGALVAAHVSFDKSTRLLVLCGCNERVKALLQMTHLDSVLRCYPTRAEAETFIARMRKQI